MKWEEIETVCMLGTDRTAIPDRMLSSLRTLGLEGLHSHSAAILLQTLSSFSKMRQGQGDIGQFEEDLPSSILPPKGKIISPTSVNHLHWILNGRYPHALEEFVALLIQENWVLPMEVWPELFGQCLIRPELFDQIRPLVQGRVAWLQQLHPDWSTLYLDLSPTEWTGAPPRDLLKWWFHYRKTNPNQAIVLLYKDWEKINGADQKKILAGLHLNLSSADIPHLVQIQEKVNGPQAKVIQQLLCLIPESMVQRELQEQVASFISFSKSGLPQLSLPSSFPDVLKAFGLAKGRTQTKGWGQKADWVFQIFSRVDPVYWEALLMKPPAEILHAWSGSEWRKMLFNAVLKASLQFKNANWLLTIGYWMVNKQYKDLWLDKLLDEYMYTASSDLMNQVVVQFLDNHPYMLDDQHLVTKLLLKNPHPWADSITKYLLGHLLDYLGGMLEFSPNIWHYKKLLKVAAYRSNPYLHDMLKVEWEGQGQPFGNWDQSLENFFRVLQFRKSMRSTLELKSNR